MTFTPMCQCRNPCGGGIDGHSTASPGQAVGVLSVVDLLICDTAAARGLVVLTTMPTIRTAERHLPDIRVRRVVSADD